MSRLASPTDIQQRPRRDRRLLTGALALALVALPMGVRHDAPLPGWQTAIAKNHNGKGGGPGGGKGNGRATAVTTLTAKTGAESAMVSTTATCMAAAAARAGPEIPAARMI